MAAPQTVLKLVETFNRNRDVYTSPAYNETQLRREFIDPYFSALGWDVANTAGYAEAYKDVIHEDALKIGSATKAPDYCFRIGGARKFFLEAKKPAVNLKHDIHPAFQLRRYAWSAKLPLSVLTDFEEFAVYDTRVRPHKADPASTARTLYLKYTEYPDRWDEIARIFSKQAVLQGSFDKYAESAKLKKGTAQVDAAFLAEIETWRDSLARHLALRNPALSNRQLNFAVQRTIDRIIFLRICEDRAIEPYAQLQALINGPHVYKRLLTIYDRADERYNSGLFYFHPEKDRPDAPDELTPKLTIDDKILKDILKNLYYPESPYEFSVLPADILGQVYEQFLGKVITLTKAHRAKVEDKPEVKKAGGVYYTPTYIVDYIVKNTVGQLLETRTVKFFKTKPPQMDQPLTILDPACGSGSFLIGAYQFLLDWYLNYYTKNDPAQWLAAKNPPITQTTSNAGVPPASNRTAGCQPASPESNAGVPPASNRTAGCQPASPESNAGVPPASNRTAGFQPASPESNAGVPPASNRTAGVPPASYRLTTTERKRILLAHLFGVDIDTQAVEVTKLSLLLKVLEGQSQQSLQNQLRLFHERALPDLSQNIKCGNSLIGPDFYENQQQTLFDDDDIFRINAFDYQTEFPHIFKGDNPGFNAVIGNPPYGGIITKEQQQYFINKYNNQDTVKDLYLLFLEKFEHLIKLECYLGVIVSNTWLQSITYINIRKCLVNRYKWSRILHIPEKVFKAVVDTHVLIFQKTEMPIDDSFNFSVDKYINGEFKEQHILTQKDLPLDGRSINIIFSKDHHKIVNKIENLSVKIRDLCNVFNGTKPFEKGKGKPPQTEKTMLEKPFVKFGTKPSTDWSPLLRGSLIKKYSNLWKNDYWILYGPWLAAPRNPSIFQAPLKLVVRQTGDCIISTLIEGGTIARDNLHILIPKENNYSLLFILGVINSKLMDIVYSFINPEKGEALAQVKKNHVENLPIRKIDFSNSTDKTRHYRMVLLVEQMLDLHKQLAAARTPDEKKVLQRQIGTTDRRIDRLTYQLYDLTDDEIKIVEETTH